LVRGYLCDKFIIIIRGDTRLAGDVHDADRRQRVAWQMHERGLDVHALAEPTKLEALRKEYRKKTPYKNCRRPLFVIDVSASCFSYS